MINTFNPEVRLAIHDLDKVGPAIPLENYEAALRAILTGKASPVETASFLASLHLTKAEEVPDILMQTVQILKSYSTPIANIEMVSPRFVDIVGTGGDGHNTFNVSTASAIVAAGAGLWVCKHGNKASTSASGSADLLMSFGCDLLNVTPKNIVSITEQCKFSFLFAPMCHPTLKNVAPIRKQLGLPTIFNLVGPLLNPIPTYARIIGVSKLSLGEVVAKTLLKLGAGRSLVVCGEEGLDEISPAGPTHTWLVRDGTITHEVYTPESFHLQSHPLSSVASGTPSANAILLEELLSNMLHANHPILDYVLMNTAALLHVAGMAESLREGVKIAQQSISSGAALRELSNFSTISQQP
ncbi:Anthranilate phosphoribosyltransferase [Schizosaccharomyces pombe]|uniref:Anthranilate phosphoribosyltransferase n=1 Tax=Schizosaccharomyces pombe (strain 972 / ATCC 24843) TaxID=284812 RepID=TRPD_SCHPO|nr:putative phosphoribosylanthranilate transferase Trp4 [Schizosaccharomyces pombe]O60122.1 RecName: Full=Anthranilate phosphoribosyltransferase [Schizosaccharomyces pombe 972h-]CAA19028.1 phosphoribosylanthranilate transferase Trp4 (predicted) [Schizosaccharomyces pombe]|eukprot:NP_596757.1 putative phosphoribosylanthranilate transferase Trp4 [Schizosaccharomyces pombe]